MRPACVLVFDDEPHIGGRVDAEAEAAMTIWIRTTLHGEARDRMSEHRPEPASEERRRSWDERHAASHPIEASHPDPLLVREAERLAPGRAIDIACGDGRNAVWLAERGWRVTGVDFSAVALHRARQRAERAGVEIDWRQHDVVEWTPAESAFDLVSLIYLQLPPEERTGVLARAARALAPGGRVVVVGHHRRNPDVGGHGPRDLHVLHDPDEIAAELVGGEGDDPGRLVVERAEEVFTEDEGGPRIDSLVVARRDA